MRAWMAGAALGTLLVTGLTGCSDDADQAVDDAADRASEIAGQASEELQDAELPDVDWSEYGDRLRTRLDQLAEQADCDGLERELARAEADDTELTAYIKKQIDRVC